VQIAIASSSLVGTPIVDALSKGRHTTSYLITNPDKRTGRGLTTKENSFAKSVSRYGLAIHKPSDHSELHALLSDQPVDLVVTAAYGRLIKLEELTLPKYGWINIHFSLLPHYRGASPVQHTILNGDELTGVSIFRLDEGMDTGPLFKQYEHRVSPTMTTPELLDDLAKLASQHIGAILDVIEKGIDPTPQSTVGISFAGKFSKDEGRVFPSDSALAAERRIRALADNPGVFINFRGARLGISGAQLTDQSGTPGTLTANKTSLCLHLLDGSLELLSVTPQGKKRMTGADFARGARIAEAEPFE